MTQTKYITCLVSRTRDFVKRIPVAFQYDLKKYYRDGRTTRLSAGDDRLFSTNNCSLFQVIPTTVGVHYMLLVGLGSYRNRK